MENTNTKIKNAKFILIFGGSKFMGLHLIEELISKKNEKDYTNKNKLYIFVVNRGNSYWNGKFSSLVENNKDWIFHYKADRRNRKEFIKCLMSIFSKANEIINKENLDLDYVFNNIIDFTAFKPKDIYNLFDFLAIYKENSFRNYIFISSDSTYNASDISLEKNNEYFINKFFVKIIKFYLNENIFIFIR